MTTATETVNGGNIGNKLSYLTEEDLIRLISESPTVRHQLTGMMIDTFAEKTDLQAILERMDKQSAEIKEQGYRIEEQGKRIEEQGKRIEEQGKRIEEQGQRIEALREDFNRQFAEHARRMDAIEKQIQTLREDFNRGFALLSRRIDALEERVDILAEKVEKGFKRVDSHLGAIGARWGMESESAFREGLADILAEETDLQVVRYHKMDTQGIVFGRPDQIEIDVAIQDGEHTLIEIKSSTSREEVHTFARKVAFYEEEEKVKVKRKIIISPMLGPGAQELAAELKIETFGSAYDVKA